MTAKEAGARELLAVAETRIRAGDAEALLRIVAQELGAQGETGFATFGRSLARLAAEVHGDVDAAAFLAEREGRT